jgi:predicted molibdopterin-dependent oxidoreductase YjgC
MAESESGKKTLEMRVAELEDKLSKVHITEEEMKAYQKVASRMGAQSGGRPSQSITSPYLFCYNCYYCYYCSRCMTECSECIVVSGPTGGPVTPFGKLGT